MPPTGFSNALTTEDIVWPAGGSDSDGSCLFPHERNGGRHLQHKFLGGIQPEGLLLLSLQLSERSAASTFESRNVKPAVISTN